MHALIFLYQNFIKKQKHKIISKNQTDWLRSDKMD